VANGAPEPTVVRSTPPDTGREALEAQRRSGGQWFFWIAALSLVNAIVAFTGQEWRFIIGLGITELVNEIAQQSGGAGVKAGLVGLLVIGIFVVLGHRAVHGACWAFVIGLILYGLDGAIFLLVQDWVGVGFHAFAIAMILRGYLAARQLTPAHS
jgi:hypothetical protein